MSFSFHSSSKTTSKRMQVFCMAGANSARSFPEDIEVRYTGEEFLVGGVIAVCRKKSFVTAAVAEHAQRFLRLAVRGGEHQEEHAEAAGDIIRAEALSLFKDQCAVGGGDIELLPVGV